MQHITDLPYSMDDIKNNVMEEYVCLLFLKDDITSTSKVIKCATNALILDYGGGMTCIKRLQQTKLIESNKKIDAKLKYYNAQKRLNKFEILYNFRRHDTVSKEQYGILRNVVYEQNGNHKSMDCFGFQCTSCMCFCDGNQLNFNRNYIDRVECQYCLQLMCGLCSHLNQCRFCLHDIRKGLIIPKTKKTGLKK